MTKTKKERQQRVEHFARRALAEVIRGDLARGLLRALMQADGKIGYAEARTLLGAHPQAFHRAVAMLEGFEAIERRPRGASRTRRIFLTPFGRELHATEQYYRNGITFLVDNYYRQHWGRAPPAGLAPPG